LAKNYFPTIINYPLKNKKQVKSGSDPISNAEDSFVTNTVTKKQ
jgi:hypothetical protein